MQIKVKLRNVRLSYCHLLEPIKFNDSDTPKYRADIIINKNDVANVEAVKNGIKEAIEKGKEKGGSFDRVNLEQIKNAGKWHNLLKDGDILKPDDPAYKDSYYISSSADVDSDRNKFGVLDRYGNKLDKDTPDANNKIYSGCYVNIVLTIYPYVFTGNYGVSSKIKAVLSLETGERLDGGTTAEEDFADEIEEYNKQNSDSVSGNTSLINDDDLF